MHRFKRRHCEKNFVANEHHSFTFVFTFSVVVVDLPTDYILSFLFPAETDVLVAVLCQSTDIVVVNFVVVLKATSLSSVVRVSVICRSKKTTNQGARSIHYGLLLHCINAHWAWTNSYLICICWVVSCCYDCKINPPYVLKSYQFIVYWCLCLDWITPPRQN